MSANNQSYRFRYNVAAPLAGAIALVGSTALAAQRWWLSPIVVGPILAFWWGLHAGVDVDATGLRIRRWWRAELVPWEHIIGFTVSGTKVQAQLAKKAITLPSLTVQDIPILLELANNYGPASDKPDTVES